MKLYNKLNLKNNKKLKDNINTLIIVIIICVIVIIYELSANYISSIMLDLKDNITNTDTVETDTISNLDNLDEVIDPYYEETIDLEIDLIPLSSNSVDKKYYVMLSERLSLLPDSLLNEVYNNGWGIIITNEDLA